ncbi:unnamed protein product [Prunus brigantina]
MDDVGHVSVGKHHGGAASPSPTQVSVTRAASSAPLHSANGLTLLSNQLPTWEPTAGIGVESSAVGGTSSEENYSFILFV